MSLPLKLFLKDRWAILLMIAASAILSLCILLVFAIFKIADAVSVPAPRASTKGKISYYDRGRRSGKYGSRISHCWVDYEVAGKTYKKMGASCFAGTEIGDEVDVVYQTTNPENANVDHRTVWNITGIIGLLFGVMSFFLLRKLIRMERNKDAPGSATPLPIVN